MTHIFGFERSQLLLLPEAVDDYVGADNPVRFIDAFVDQLDLAAAGFIRVAPTLKIFAGSRSASCDWNTRLGLAAAFRVTLTPSFSGSLRTLRPFIIPTPIFRRPRLVPGFDLGHSL